MKIDALFMDYDKYIITIDGVPMGVDPIGIGELIIIKAWLRKNMSNLQSYFDYKIGLEIFQEMKLSNETRGDVEQKR